MLDRLKAAARVAGYVVLVGTPVLLRDLIGLAGAAGIAYGAWLIYSPAGYVVGGALLLAGAIMSGRS